MKPLFAIVLICGLLISFAAVSGNTETGTLVLNMINFKDDKGSVRIALARSRDELDFKKTPYRLIDTAIVHKKAQWIFRDLPYGEYAIKLYHDENGNKKIDTNFLGIPKEGYGFSNNATGHFGPPDYDQVKFTINEPSTDITIEIVH